MTKAKVTSLKAWETTVKELWSYNADEMVEESNKWQLGHQHHRLQHNNRHRINC